MESPYTVATKLPEVIPYMQPNAMMLPADEVDSHTKLRMPDSNDAVYKMFIAPKGRY